MASTFPETCLIVFFSFLIFCFSYSQSLQECKFSSIFNFGDSNSDTGRAAARHPLRFPYGMTFFGRPYGRLSDGRLIIDFIANNLSLPFVNPYLGTSSGNYMTGANFAVSGARILPSNHTLQSNMVNPNYLGVQYQNFTELVAKGVLPKGDFLSRALYSTDIGQNDIGIMLSSGMTIEAVNAMVPSLVDAIAAHVKALYDLGARRFWVHNTGPLGCLEYMLATPRPPSVDEIDQVGCRVSYNDVAQNFNNKLKESITSLRTELPLAAITYVNIYSIKYSLFSQPERYGFSQPLLACCARGKPCSEPWKKVNWDRVHYTDAANKAAYDLLTTGQFSDPSVPPSFSCNRL